jgi:leucyl aminopeptidase
MWYAQETIQARGHDRPRHADRRHHHRLGPRKRWRFSNNDAFCNAFLKAAKTEGEGAWRMPLGPAYDEKLKSRVADMKNVGGRDAGSITAAQFLQRFVKEDTPWIHLDIAGVAQRQGGHDAGAQGGDGLGRAGARPAGARRLRGVRRGWERPFSTT